MEENMSRSSYYRKSKRIKLLLMRIRQKSIRINKLEYEYVKFNFMRAFKVGIEPTFFLQNW